MRNLKKVTKSKANAELYAQEFWGSVYADGVKYNVYKVWTGGKKDPKHDEIISGLYKGYCIHSGALGGYRNFGDAMDDGRLSKVLSSHRRLCTGYEHVYNGGYFDVGYFKVVAE